MANRNQQSKSNKEAKKISPSPVPIINLAPKGDEYKAPKHQIWDDIIRHERVLEKIWEETWESTMIPKDIRPPNLKKGRTHDIPPVLKPKSSSPISPKASAVVGWRSSDSKHSLELFGVKYISNKIRFVPEQYGYYRHMKYHESDSKESRKEEAFPPNKGIKHTVKCLLC